VVAATNRDLEVEVREGRFREDLWYRINVIPIHLPPLRQRGDDVRLLARHFLERERERLGRTDLEGFTPEALEALQGYAWPGNVRELENAIARAAALAPGPLVREEDLPDRVRGAVPAGRGFVLPGDMTLAEMERLAILHALEVTRGNKKEAAARLGISLATLYRKLDRYQRGNG